MARRARAETSVASVWRNFGCTRVASWKAVAVGQLGVLEMLGALEVLGVLELRVELLDQLSS